MEKIQIEGFRAIDGKLFVSESDCHEYEYTLDTLENHIKKFCGSTYCDDYGYNVIEVEDVALYIRNNLTEIIRIANSGYTK